MHIIDQSERSDIVKLSRPVLFKKERHLVMSKKEKWQNSKVDQCDLVRKVQLWQKRFIPLQHKHDGNGVTLTGQKTS